ncbi:hypothetical protein ccbrp13_40850 [Ktedonobacteria bacterium brp13]|nr:hypothetical protein ccbrp13_40850 [Ktedonobacteria bacterium brp13]
MMIFAAWCIILQQGERLVCGVRCKNDDQEFSVAYVPDRHACVFTTAVCRVRDGSRGLYPS